MEADLRDVDDDAIGIVERKGAELDLLVEIEARRVLDALAHVFQFSLANHVVDAVLELARHAARAAYDHARGLERLGQILGADHDQGDLAVEEQPAAVETVGEGAAEERGDDQRAELGGADQPGEEGRAGDHEHLVGERDEGRLGAEAGDQRAHREQAEIPRLAQGLDVDRYTG